MLSLIERFQLWRMWRQVEKSWHESAHGACRYTFTTTEGRGHMEFNAPRAEHVGDLAQLMRQAADLLDQVHVPKSGLYVIDGGKKK